MPAFKARSDDLPDSSSVNRRSGERPSLRLAGLLDLAAVERPRIHLLSGGIVAQLKHVAGVPGADEAISAHAEAERAAGALDDLLRGRPLARLYRLVKVMASAVTTKVDGILLREYPARAMSRPLARRRRRIR